MSNAWGEVQSWAKSEIETARTALETETAPESTAALRARIAVMRDLLNLKTQPKPAEIPGPVSY